MAIPGGGHIKLNGVTYTLTEQYQSGPPIRTDLENVYYPTTDIPGTTPNKRSARPELLFWSHDDWSGGEGAKVFDDSDSTVYYTGKGNGRNPGYMTSTPQREDSAVHAALTNATTAAFATTGGGYAWCVSTDGSGESATPDRRLRYSADVDSWSSSPFNGTRGSSTLANEQVPTAIVSGARFLYIATWDGTNSSDPNIGDTFVYWLDMTDPTVDVYNFEDLSASHTAAPYAGMAILSVSGVGSASKSKLYGWTGKNLWSYDLSAAPAAIANTNETRTLEYSSSTEDFIGRVGTSFYADICATDNSVVMFYSNPNDRPLVWEFKDGVGRPIWGEGIPRGFTARAMCYALGNLYLAGTFNDKAAVFGLNMVSYQPFFVGFIRYHNDLTQVTPTSISPGLGTQVMVGCSAGQVFIIDFDGDVAAISQLDQRASVGACVDMLTFQTYRVGFFNDTSSKQIKASRWSPDDIQSTGTAPDDGGGDGTLTSSMYDFDLPFETKQLLGYRVITELLSGAKTVTVAYDNDEVGSFTSLTTLPSTSNGIVQYTTGDHFIPVSGPSDATTGPTSTVKFRILRDKVTVAGGAKVYSVTAIAKPTGYSRVFTVAIRLFHEGRGQDSNRPRASNRLAETIRSTLRALRTSGNVISFVDGSGLVTPNSNTTYNVVVDDYWDDVEDLPQTDRGSRSGTEGIAVLKLREVSPGG